MSKTINNYITVLDYADKTLLVLLGADSGVSLFSFTNVIGTTVVIASASNNLVFLVTNAIEKKNINSKKFSLLARSKLKSIEK